MRRAWVVRHAPVDAAGLCYGRSDVPVLVAPEAAAVTVRAALDAAGMRPTAVRSSPAPRCVGLGRALAELLALPATEDPRLAEMSFGAWEGRPYAELEQEPAFQRWMDAWRTEAPPGGETLDQLEQRARSLCADPAAGDALLVTHAGVIRALRVVCGGLAWDDAMAEAVPYLEPRAVALP